MSRPLLHALLNLTSALLLVAGWMAITGRGPWSRAGRDERVHKRLMLSALVVSGAFLVSYVHYHATVGHVAFWGAGAIRSVYLAVLVPHVVLAVAMVPAIALVVTAAARGRLDRHRRLARWTLPVWLYVSVTGVIVYVMLYGMAPAGASGGG